MITPWIRRDKIVLLALTLALLVINIPITTNVFSEVEWIKPGVYVKYFKTVDFTIFDNQTLSLSSKLNVLNYSRCLEDSIYKVITYSELSFAMVKEILNISATGNPFCSYLEIIDEGSRATSTSDSEIALVFSWYTLPTFQFKLVDKEGYLIPWFSGIYIFFTPMYVKEVGSEFSDYVQKTLDSKYYGLDTLIDASINVQYNANIGFMNSLFYSVTICFRMTNETSYTPALRIALNIRLVETNIPVERIELMQKIKLPLVITGVSIGIIIGILFLRIKLKKYLSR